MYRKPGLVTLVSRSSSAPWVVDFRFRFKLLYDHVLICRNATSTSSTRMGSSLLSRSCQIQSSLNTEVRIKCLHVTRSVRSSGRYHRHTGNWTMYHLSSSLIHQNRPALLPYRGSFFKLPALLCTLFSFRNLGHERAHSKLPWTKRGSLWVCEEGFTKWPQESCVYPLYIIIIQV